jgi:hypothetical protein
VSLEIDLRLSLFDCFTKPPHFSHWFEVESTFADIDARISTTEMASLLNPSFANEDESDLWKKLYRTIGRIRQTAMESKGAGRGEEYALCLFMCATEEMALQQNPRHHIVLMALALALAQHLEPQ